MGKTWRPPPPPPKAPYVAPQVDFTSRSGGAEVVRVTGAAALAANLLLMPQVARDATNREMAVIAHEVILDAQANFVPIDTGDLSLSGDSDEYVEGSAQTITQIAMWFGGEPDVEQMAHGVKDTRKYALEQHENMEFRHTVGGPKYLERPFAAVLDTVGPRIAAAIAGALQMNPSFVSMALLSPDEPITSVDPDFGGK